MIDAGKESTAVHACDELRRQDKSNAAHALKSMLHYDKNASIMYSELMEAQTQARWRKGNNSERAEAPESRLTTRVPATPPNTAEPSAPTTV